MIYILVGGNLLMAATFLFRLPTLPPELPLFYSRPWGEEQLADFWMIILIPLLANLIYFLNDYLYKKYFPGNFFVQKIFEYLNIFIMVSFTLIFIKIIFLVT